MLNLIAILGFIFAIWPNFIELSSQSELPSDDERVHLLTHDGPSSSFSEVNHPSSENSPPAKSPARASSLARSASTSSSINSPIRLPSPGKRVPGLELMDIRLIPRMNPEQVFQLRRYYFPSNINLRACMRHNRLGPIPLTEQIVLSTTDGDVFAILASSDVLAGLFERSSKGMRPVKYNMFLSKVSALNEKVSDEIEVGMQQQIKKNYEVVNIRDTHLHLQMKKL